MKLSSYKGKDLNRQFKDCDLSMYPCVKLVKDLAKSLKRENPKGFFAYFDLHGHSAKRNVFVYGPEYTPKESLFIRSRLIPKLISNKTQMFRYSSCNFLIPSFKKHTGRGYLFFSLNVPFCYTVEASFGSFMTSDRIRMDFNSNSFCDMVKI